MIHNERMRHIIEMGKKKKPSKNEPIQNAGFAKNRTESKSKKKCTRARTEPYPVQN